MGRPGPPRVLLHRGRCRDDDRDGTRPGGLRNAAAGGVAGVAATGFVTRRHGIRMRQSVGPRAAARRSRSVLSGGGATAAAVTVELTVARIVTHRITPDRSG